MGGKLEEWLTTNGSTLPDMPDVSPALAQRLQFIAALLAEIAPPVAAPGLLFRDGTGRAQAVSITSRCVVGRETSADLVLADRKLSRQHFCVSCEGTTAWIEDLVSRNGTYVNGNRVKRRHLRDGDVIEAGGHILVFLNSAPLERETREESTG